MGSFLEKQINWEKEARRLDKFLNKIETIYKSASDLNIDKIKILKEVKHFKKAFSEE